MTPLSRRGTKLANGPIQEFAILQFAKATTDDQPMPVFLKDVAELCSLASTNDKQSNTFAVLRRLAQRNTYLLTGVWSSLAAHHSWIASDKNKALLARMPNEGAEILAFFHFASPHDRLPAWLQQGSAGMVCRTTITSQEVNNTSQNGSVCETGGWRIEASDDTNNDIWVHMVKVDTGESPCVDEGPCSGVWTLLPQNSSNH